VRSGPSGGNGSAPTTAARPPGPAPAGPPSQSCPSRHQVTSRQHHLRLPVLRHKVPRPTVVSRLQPALHPRRPRRALPALPATRRPQRPVRPTTTGPDRLTSAPPEAGNFDEHLWGLSVSGISVGFRSGKHAVVDVFRSRVLFPAHDRYGQLVGWAGRSTRTAPPQAPAWLNSPAGDYRKAELLHGLHEGRTRLAAGATPVLCEGVLDAHAVTLATHHACIGLAPGGTALTAQHVAALHQALPAETAAPERGHTRPRVLVAFDPDDAGRHAAVAAWPMLHAAGLDTALVELPTGTDPATPRSRWRTWSSTTPSTHGRNGAGGPNTPSRPAGPPPAPSPPFDQNRSAGKSPASRPPCTSPPRPSPQQSPTPPPSPAPPTVLTGC